MMAPFRRLVNDSQALGFAPAGLDVLPDCHQAACTACHSLYGDGNIQAGFPKISGQQKGYLISTLKEYRSQSRNAGNYALVMQAASANLKDNDIEALANYMHGLYRK